MKRISYTLAVLGIWCVSGVTYADYTKVSNAGQALPVTATLGAESSAWGCTYDSASQLIWEVRTTDGGLRDNRATYSWFNNNPNESFEFSGTPNGGSCFDNQNCDTEKYTQQVNAVGLCNAKDWRMPTIDELKTLVKRTTSAPTIDTTYFPNTPVFTFWSATTNIDFPEHAWYVDFTTGVADYASFNKSGAGKVRLVRSAQKFNPTVSNANSTAIPANTCAADGALVKFDYLGTCGYTQNSSFTLDKKSNVSRIRIWYDTARGTNTLNYTIRRTSDPNISPVATPYSWQGVTTKGGCDTFQTNWCEGNIDLNQQLDAGTYTVSVDSNSMCANPSGQTTLVVNGCHRFVPVLASGSLIEPNDSPAQAVPILVNDVVQQQLLDSATDEDWFEFYVKKGVSYTIEIPGNSVGKSINPVLEVYDAAGNLFSGSINSGVFGQGESTQGIPGNTGLFRIRVRNAAPIARSASQDNGYQLRVYLTDSPQQGLVRGKVTNTCSHTGISQVEVAAWLGDAVADAALTHKTGEFGLLLNPNDYNLKSSVTQFNDHSRLIRVTQEPDEEVQFDMTPLVSCDKYIPPSVDPVTLAQQAVAIFNEASGVLIVRDVVAGGLPYYAELLRVNDKSFSFLRAFAIPGTFHAQPATYDFNTLLADFPSYFASNKSYKLQLRNNVQGIFNIEKLEPRKAVAH